MKADFWHEKWATNEIGFHEAEGNLLLTRNFSALSLAPNSRVFLPLCGKTLDIHWLHQNGHRVVGAELSKTAIDQLFRELNIQPTVTETNGMLYYRGEGIDVFVGDIFALTEDILGPVDAIYDRAALVALPPDMRRDYTAHLVTITNKAPQLLICFAYDQSVMEGPPFSIDEAEVRRQYAAHYRIDALDQREFPGGLKGFCPSLEMVWHLRS